MSDLRQPVVTAVPFVMLSVIVFNAGGAIGAQQTQSAVHHFDFGAADSAVTPGYTGVTATDMYDTSRGYGWLGQPPSVVEFPQPEEDMLPHHRSAAKVYANNADELKRDAAVSEDDVAFRVDVPNGTYRVTLMIGDLRQRIGSIDVYLNDSLSAEHIAAFTPQHRNLLNRSLGWWNEVRRTVVVQDGSLRIRLTENQTYYDSEVNRQDVDERKWAAQFPAAKGVDIYARVGYREPPFIFCGFPFSHHALMGLEVTPHRPAPIAADDDLLRLTEPIESPALAQAIDAFNQRNFNESLTALNEVNEDSAQVARAIVQLWLVGRLEIEQFAGLLHSALATLRPYCAAHPEENGVAEILEDAETFARALAIHDNRGHITFGEGHFGQNSRAIGYWWLIPETSPVYYRAQLFIARAAHMLVPYLPTRGTERAIFESLEKKFPDNRFVRYQLYQEWENHGDGSDYYDWVWNDHESEVTDAPPWARALYPAFQNYVDWCEWWFKFRQDDQGSLGGGWGDDVEIIGAMAYNAYVSPDISELLTTGTRRFMNGLWNHSEIDPELGFYQPLWDAEHVAEWTGNSLGMAAQIDYGNPTWVERSMKTAKLMRDLWTDFDNDGLRRFRANYFGAATVGEHRLHGNDSWINYRAIRPASTVFWYNQNPATARVMTELADGWLTAALSSARGKPRGIIPKHVGFPEGTLGGHDSPTWYEAPERTQGTVNRPWIGQSYKGYIHDLLMMAHESTGDEKYLEPLRLEYELAEKYGNVPASSTAARLQTIPGTKMAAARSRRQPKRGTATESGSEPWVATNLNSVNAWLLAKQKLDGRSGALVNDITIDDIVRNSHHSTKELRRLFPLFTTEAGPTDRIGFIGCMNPVLIYTGGRFGGPTIQCAVTYRNTTRQFAAAVLGSDPQGFRLLYYSLAPDARTISLVPWDLEPGGRYVLRYGPDADDDQIMDSVAEQREFEFPQRGTEVLLEVDPRVTYVVEVDQLERGGLPALAPDPGLSPDDIRYAPYAQQILARIHNIGSHAIRGVEVAAWDGDPQAGGSLISTAVIPNIEAPVNLEPRTTTIGFPWQPTQESHEIYIVIDPAGKVSGEITTFNNTAHATIQKPVGPRANRG